MSTSGSKSNEHMAHFLVDIHTITLAPENSSTLIVMCIWFMFNFFAIKMLRRMIFTTFIIEPKINDWNKMSQPFTCYRTILDLILPLQWNHNHTVSPW